MIKIKCEECKYEIEYDKKSIENDEYIQCPICGKITKNPIYEK